MSSAAAARQQQPGQTRPRESSSEREKASNEAAHDPYSKLPPVPDLDNRRFCRACEAMLPIEAFPRGKRRYLCKRHMWLRVKKPSKERARADPHKKLLSVLWKRCWNDAKTAFGHSHIALLQRDIAAVLAGFDFGKDVNSETGAIALLPADPAQLLSRENHIVVENAARRELLRVYQRGGAEKYAAALGVSTVRPQPPRTCADSL